MLEICFFVEKRSLEPKEITFERWQTLCTAFGVEHCYLLDIAAIEWEPRGLTTAFTRITSFEEIPKDKTFVFIEKDAPLNREPVSIADFVHPDSALYCFGGNACGMPYAWHEQKTTLAGDWVKLAECSLWADQSAAIVLASRGQKSGGNR